MKLQLLTSVLTKFQLVLDVAFEAHWHIKKNLKNIQLSTSFVEAQNASFFSFKLFTVGAKVLVSQFAAHTCSGEYPLDNFQISKNGLIESSIAIMDRLLYPQEYHLGVSA